MHTGIESGRESTLKFLEIINKKDFEYGKEYCVDSS